MGAASVACDREVVNCTSRWVRIDDDRELPRRGNRLTDDEISSHRPRSGLLDRDYPRRARVYSDTVRHGTRDSAVNTYSKKTSCITNDGCPAAGFLVLKRASLAVRTLMSARTPPPLLIQNTDAHAVLQHGIGVDNLEAAGISFEWSRPLQTP